ncbi:hypothetical protein LTR91_002175 [Friedmanniomyces endolithicus]|uniref:Uncharacterized protein n=1 Tax=Friedmanniomyces endolithicus TaxID=329885 RepID=A0AAN6L0L6_9PEZI|nr:hypothetical protein LTS00_003155 [Friedmanniomyces endolithicus]KAK0975681.1 hypothetical protein LTS01_013775 [Friedmanniomyces endolithicus]KAK1011703.1 hypothetical protein LTR91_002175 [Friedmanniomyces endolithicus]KAK1015802.1 hypothetical protein LTR54_003531 [Friedmanniomyces endolithicus]
MRQTCHIRESARHNSLGLQYHEYTLTLRDHPILNNDNCLRNHTVEIYAETMAASRSLRVADAAHASVHGSKDASDGSPSETHSASTLRVNEVEYRIYTRTSLTFLLGLPDGRYLVRASSTVRALRAKHLVQQLDDQTGGKHIAGHPLIFMAVDAICDVLRRENGSRPSARDLAADIYQALKEHDLISQALKQATAGVRFQQSLCDFVPDMVEETLKLVVGVEGIRRASRKGSKGVARTKYNCWVQQSRRVALY